MAYEPCSHWKRERRPFGVLGSPMRTSQRGTKESFDGGYLPATPCSDWCCGSVTLHEVSTGVFPTSCSNECHFWSFTFSFLSPLCTHVRTLPFFGPAISPHVVLLFVFSHRLLLYSFHALRRQSSSSFSLIIRLACVSVCEDVVVLVCFL